MFLWNIIAIFIDFRFRFRWSVPLELSLWVYLGVTILRDQPQGAKVLRIEANLEQTPIDPNNIMTLIWYICFWGGGTKNTYLGKFEFWNVDISGLFHPTPSLGTLSKIFPLFSDVFLTILHCKFVDLFTFFQFNFFLTSPWIKDWSLNNDWSQQNTATITNNPLNLQQW